MDKQTISLKINLPAKEANPYFLMKNKKNLLTFSDHRKARYVSQMGPFSAFMFDPVRKNCQMIVIARRTFQRAEISRAK